MFTELIALWEEYKKNIDNRIWPSDPTMDFYLRTFNDFMSWLQEREKQKELKQHEIMNIE